MPILNPNDAQDTTEFVFSKEFDACNVVDICQYNPTTDVPYYVIANKSDTLPVRFKTLAIDIPPAGHIDLLSLTKFRRKKISSLQDFVRNCFEIRDLEATGLAESRTNIFDPPIFRNNFVVSVHEWNEGNPRRVYGKSAMHPDQVAITALTFYLKYKNLRCISCLRFPNDLKHFFFEKFPNEIEDYKKTGIAGYSTFKFEYLQALNDGITSLTKRAYDKHVGNI